MILILALFSLFDRITESGLEVYITEIHVTEASP
jgi:hypothetical protein